MKKPILPDIDDVIRGLRKRNGSVNTEAFFLAMALGAHYANAELDEPSAKINRLFVRLLRQAATAATKRGAPLRLVKKKSVKE